MTQWLEVRILESQLPAVNKQRFVNNKRRVVFSFGQPVSVVGQATKQYVTSSLRNRCTAKEKNTRPLFRDRAYMGENITFKMKLISVINPRRGSTLRLADFLPVATWLWICCWTNRGLVHFYIRTYVRPYHLITCKLYIHVNIDKCHIISDYGTEKWQTHRLVREGVSHKQNSWLSI
jgi:hypothetical protein